MKKIKEEWLKKFSSLMQKLEGDGPMWFWNGDKQIYLRNCDEDVWQFIESSLLSQKKDLKLKAQAIGTPDGYVNIEKLFDDTPDMDLKEVLEKL